MSSFDDAFDALIGNEGGYSFNPKDPGGETMWGVTARVARVFGYMGAMKDLPRDMARNIAKRMYWDPLKLDGVDPRIGFQCLDANYNGGHVIVWMQQACGVKADGVFGEQTQQAMRAVDPLRFILRFNACRGNYYTMLTAWATFGKGWARRVFNNLLKGAL